MLLIYTDTITHRLSYICNFIFKEQLGVDFSICNDVNKIKNHENYIINYSTKKLVDVNEFCVPRHQLLFENNIQTQNLDVGYIGDMPLLFKMNVGDIEFDMFAASFFLMSRYEEYLPHQKDAHGRFPPENSIAFQYRFLHTPLINIWIDYLGEKLRLKFPGIQYFKPSFTSIITYDIDMPWSYKNKGFIRNLGGFLKRPSLERWAVLSGLQKDPYDSFDFIQENHQKKKTLGLFFFLVAEKRSNYDKNISPKNKSYKKLIKQINQSFTIGLHPSWSCDKENTLLLQEKNNLTQISEKPIIHSRQHYIKLRLPDTYEQLLLCNIQNDFSMGYPTMNGFRASVASSFFWFDLKNNISTALRIYPFCFMDANCHYHLKLSIKESLSSLISLKSACEKVNGLFIPIFHNNFLGSDVDFKGWNTIYTNMMSELL